MIVHIEYTFPANPAGMHASPAVLVGPLSLSLSLSLSVCICVCVRERGRNGQS